MSNFSKTLLAAALFGAVPMLAHAESRFVTGSATPLNATAQLDFQVTVPKVLYLRVGAGTNMATLGTINLIDFAVPAASIGNGTPVVASAASGDQGNGVVTARVIGNNGNITFTSMTQGPLNNGVPADTISYSQITTTVSALTSAVPLPHPALADSATTTVALTPVSGKVINRDANWTFAYANSNVVAPGTYGGAGVNNGRVTYTASMP